MYKIIHKNFSHHHVAIPIDTAGSWKVYKSDDVEAGWPNNGHCLVLDATQESISILKNLGDRDKDERWDLPEEIVQEDS